MTYTQNLLQDLLRLLQNNPILQGDWKYLALALLVAVEGPIATLLGAAAAASGLMRADLVFIAASLGNLSADTTWYFLGYSGKKEWLLRVGHRFGLTAHLLDYLQEKIQLHAPKLLLIAKLTNGLIIPSLITAGLARVPWKRWFPPVAAGEMVWTGSLVLIGYFATQTIQQLQKDIHIFVLVASAVLLISILLIFIRVLQQKGANLFTSFSDEK